MKGLVDEVVVILTCLGAGSLLVAFAEYAASYKKQLRTEVLAFAGELEAQCTAQ